MLHQILHHIHNVLDERHQLFGVEQWDKKFLSNWKFLVHWHDFQKGLWFYKLITHLPTCKTVCKWALTVGLRCVDDWKLPATMIWHQHCVITSNELIHTRCCTHPYHHECTCFIDSLKYQTRAMTMMTVNWGRILLVTPHRSVIT